MKDEELFRIAKKFIADEDTCMNTNYKNKIVEECNKEDLLLDIKIEMQNQLGICGCGCPEIVLEGFYDILSKIKEMTDSIITVDHLINKYNKIYDELRRWALEDWTHLQVLYDLDNVGYTDHGSSIFGAWITDEGRDFLIIFEDKNFNCHY